MFSAQGSCPGPGGTIGGFVSALTLDSVRELNASAPVEGREAAFELFELLPAPEPTDEAWRYVEKSVDFARYRLPQGTGSALARDEMLAGLETVQRVVLLDGLVVAVEGEGFARSGLTLLDMVPPGVDKLAAAHRAFVPDGVTIDVPAHKHTQAPILVEVQSTEAGTVSFPHVTVRLGENSEAEVILAFRSPAGVDAFAVPQVEIDLGPSARLRLLNLQEFSTDASIVVQQRVRLDRDATARLGEVGLGGDLARLDLAVDLDGQGSSTQVAGVFFGYRDQVLDYRMVLNHRGPKSSSNVLLKGAVEDSARSVFSGLVRIEKLAFGASAFETNRNLVLSPDAKANSIPNLEILCDDVICGHGSSVGPLEDEHLYYLQSRGISEERSERMLVRGFFNQVLDQLPVKGVESSLSDILERRFLDAQEHGS